MEEPLLRTAIVTRYGQFSTRTLFRYLLGMPMMTVGVIMRIHLQAFKLWRQGARYNPVPPLPEREATTNDAGGRG
jgi:DUF1365 family protein